MGELAAAGGQGEPLVGQRAGRVVAGGVFGAGGAAEPRHDEIRRPQNAGKQQHDGRHRRRPNQPGAHQGGRCSVIHRPLLAASFGRRRFRHEARRPGGGGRSSGAPWQQHIDGEPPAVAGRGLQKPDDGGFRFVDV